MSSLTQTKNLTSINLETVKLLAHGLTCRKVAKEMCVTEKAIFERVNRIKKRLNCDTIIQVVYTLAKSGTI